MDSEQKNVDATDKKNVKERLNTLLHKKIMDQHEKHEVNNAEERINPGVKGVSEQETPNELTEGVENDEEFESDSDDESANQFILHEVLNEKKKALLQNKEVINILQGKFKCS